MKDSTTMNLFSESTHFLDVAKKAAMSVDEPLRTAFRSAMTYTTKRDLRDIVTVHDKASEERITEVILSAVPDSTIIGEEGGRKGGGAVHWYIDPIDGTANFARGIAHWCVSIAAAVDNQVIAGVVYDPIARHLFSADLWGAYLNGQPITARAYAEEQQATLVSSFPSARILKALGTKALAAQADFLNTFLGVRNLGSAALNLCNVAAGWVDGTFGLDSNPWDVAAGMLIVQQARGSFVGYRDGELKAPAFLQPDYFAVGKGADYPTLERIISEMSAARRVAAEAARSA
jgi:myo-inositol-1(or 4)-monophosphatase